MIDVKPQQKKEDIAQILRNVPPFSSLPINTLRKLARKIKRRMFPAESYVFRQGEESKNVIFIIVSGLAEVSVKNEKGKDSIAAYRRDYEFFGETVLLSNKPYPVSVRALTDLDCLLLNREDFEEILDTNAAFASYFSQLIVDRFFSLFREVALEHGMLVTAKEHAAHKRASELMSSPVITCSPDETINMVAKIMRDNHISSVVITGTGGEVQGLITEKDLVDKVLAEGRAAERLTAREIADSEPVCISLERYYYQVLLAMIKKQAKHTIVTEQNKPVGIITIRDLIRSRNTGVISVVDRLESQSDLKGISQVGQEIDQVLRGLVADKAPVPEILDIITELYDRLTRQVIEISLNSMMPEYGPPPVKFCWLSMGSNGRREQYVRTDQDNALIYETPPGGASVEEIEKYFARLAGQVVQGLASCGFALCRGYVMASNSFWRGDEKYWRSKVSAWVRKPEKFNIRLLSIFLDFRPVYGHLALGEDLRVFTNKCFSSQPLALRFLAEDACQGRLPLGLFGRPVGERSGEHKDEIDLKHSVSVHLVDCIRLLALRENLMVTNTLERIYQLHQKGKLSKELTELLETAFQTIMLFRLRSSLEKMHKGEKPDNYLNLAAMSRREKSVLRDALKAIEELVAITRETFLPY